MLRAPFTPVLRTALCVLSTLLLLSWGQSALAAEGQLHMRIDGVSGDGSVPSPLGKDAFPLRNFTVPIGMGTEVEGPPKPGRPELEDLKFNLAIASPAVKLWQLALTGEPVPKASLAALDAAGKVRYRIDLEQVVVKSFSLQTFGSQRETLLGSLGYDRIRITLGEGKNAVVAGWDRVRNQAWK